MQVWICDDSAEDRQALCNCVKRWLQQSSTEVELYECESAEMLIEKLKSSTQPDILFLDIYMGELSGIDAAKYLQTVGYHGHLIFCTSSAEYGAESYQYHADGYLLKPFEYDAFLRAIWRCQEMINDSAKKLSFISDHVSYELSLAQVSCIEGDAGGCIVHTDDHSLFTWKRLWEFENELADENSYLKIGRTYIVNLEKIKSLSVEQIIMSDDLTILIPRREQKRIRQLINDYQWSRV